jgi:hypothetical protein
MTEWASLSLREKVFKYEFFFIKGNAICYFISNSKFGATTFSIMDLRHTTDIRNDIMLSITTIGVAFSSVC